MEQRETVIIGAGAAGLFCAAQAGQLGVQVTVLDSGKKAGRKILMSGGGRCNFTNLSVEAKNYVSHNPHFCKSALARYSQWDFIELINRYGIAYHEREHGQLFCDNSAEEIVNLLLQECANGQVEIRLRSEVQGIERVGEQFLIHLPASSLLANNLVVATGGLSMPGLGGSPLGYQIAEQFGLPVRPTRSGLVPLTLHKPLLTLLQELSGIAVPVTVTTASGISFRENLLFTHRGLSGPVILQASNYWLPGELLTINLIVDQDLAALIQQERSEHPNQQLKTVLTRLLPKRLVDVLQMLAIVPDLTLKQLTLQRQQQLIEQLQNWPIQPNGTEGYRTAEVTLGGVDTLGLSSKTMQASQIPGLYFIGETVDVTGWLGGYNFQWAWSSAWACAQALVGY